MNSLVTIIGSLDNRSREPLYRQLQRKLRGSIESGALNPDDPLPAERDLAKALKVSRITIRKALKELVREGLLTRRQGSGTFVANRVEKNFSHLTSFSEDMRSRGLVPSSKWLEKKQSVVTSEEVMNYGLSPGTKVYRLSRIRIANNEPMSVEFAIVPTFCVPDIESFGQSLYETLNQHGYKPARALQRLRAVLLSEEQADLLNANPNDPGLLVERRGFTQDDRIIEISHSYYRGDTYDFIAELNV